MRVVPRTRKDRYCPKCGVGTMVKAGRTQADKQLWQCRKCSYRTKSPIIKR